MDFKHLRLFVEVAKHGNLSKAAIAGHKTQPIISRQIRTLEAEIGTPLFHRTGHGLRLTEAGEKLMLRANRIMDELSQAEIEMRTLGETQLTNATIALPTSVGHFLTKPLVRAVLELNPDMRLRIMEATSGPILDWIIARKVDVAVLYDTVAVSRLLTQPLISERLYLVQKPGPSALPSSIDFKQLERLPLILPGPSEGLRLLMEMAAAKAGIQLTVKIEADTLSTIKQLVEEGHGSGILPLSTVRQELEAGKLTLSSFSNLDVSRNLVIATSAARLPAAGLNELVRIIKKLVSDTIGSTTTEERPASKTKTRKSS